MARSSSWVLIGSLWVLSACGPQQSDLGHLGQPILGGQPVVAGEFAEVVLVAVSAGGYGGMCTGTLISPRVVLTAAHCLDFEGLTPRGVAVRFGESRRESIGVLAEDFQLHPAWDPDQLTNDLGLIRLEKDPPVVVTPAPHLPAALELTSADVGGQLTFVGFGLNDLGLDETKLWMTAELAVVCTRTYGCGFAQRNTLCIDQEPTGICSGDSGGPAFVLRSGVRYVAGVNSYTGSDPDTGQGCLWFGCATKVDEFQAWIDDYVGAPDGSACSLDNECASVRCSDGVCCREDCDGLCQACNLVGQVGSCLPVADQTPCDDGNLCNGQETCQAGSCASGEPLVCADQVACTRDLCDPRSGCEFSPSVLECFDDNPCTDDLCDRQAGCLHEPLPDGIACDLRSQCLAGQCVALPADSGCGCAGSGSASGLGGLGLLCLALLIGWGGRVFRSTGRSIGIGTASPGR